jgi:predicted GNAT family acetyltransferase
MLSITTTSSRYLFILNDSGLSAEVIVAVDSEKLNINLNNIFINEAYRGKGKSYSLLYTIFTYVKNIYPTIKTITLDDMTERYRMPLHNLYINLGFEYIEDYGPEMIADYDKVIKNLRKHLKRI